MPKKQTPSYWVDWLGYIWFGPMASGLYERFEGIDSEMREIWTQYPYSVDALLKRFPSKKAHEALAMHAEDARMRR